jgi:hypothetical protein
MAPLRITAGALAALLVLLAGCTALDGEDPENNRFGGLPDQEFNDGRLWLYRQERILGSLEARVIEQYERDSRLRLIGQVKVVDIDSLGQVSTTLTCDTLHFYRARQDFDARGHVVVYSEPTSARLGAERGPLRLATEQLEWTNRLARIHTAREVVFETDQDTLYGVGFSSNRDLTSWEILNPSGVTHRAVTLPEEP